MGRIKISVIVMALRKRGGKDGLLLIPAEQGRKGLLLLFHTFNGQADGGVDFLSAAHALEGLFFLDTGELFKILFHGQIIGQIAAKDLHKPFMA